MSDWKEFQRKTIDGVDLVVRERMDIRNHFGAIEYIVEASINGRLVRHERISQSVWEGHCSGQLLLPIIAKKALKTDSQNYPES